jgi:predicted cupin superfamily sugar epimerase
MRQTLSAQDVIALLGLRAHPEGGHYRETFRDPSPAGARAASTAIYFLLSAGDVTRWHRVDASEGWHWYAGAALQLEIAAPDAMPSTTLLGGDLIAGERPQAIVPQRHWQRARSLGDWTLAGCTVAPGFEFGGFVLAHDGFQPGST